MSSSALNFRAKRRRRHRISWSPPTAHRSRKQPTKRRGCSPPDLVGTRQRLATLEVGRWSRVPAGAIAARSEPRPRCCAHFQMSLLGYEPSLRYVRSASTPRASTATRSPAPPSSGRAWRVVLTYARPGDVIVGHTLDRLGGTVRDTLNMIHELEERGVGSVTGPTDQGRLIEPGRSDGSARGRSAGAVRVDGAHVHAGACGARPRGGDREGSAAGSAHGGQPDPVGLRPSAARRRRHIADIVQDGYCPEQPVPAFAGPTTRVRSRRTDASGESCAGNWVQPAEALRS
jgi:hypothetical protein